jgi:cell division protein FtsQ
MKRIQKILLWGLLLLYFPVMLGFIAEHKADVMCRDVVVSVQDSSFTRFVTSGGIRDAVLAKFEQTLGKELSTLPINEIEQFVEKHPAIKNCEVYYTIGGHLKVDLRQHLPLYRVFEDTRSYYIDEEGQEMPQFDSFTARVLVVSGDIGGKKDDLLYLARLFRQDPFWNAQIEQLYVKRNGDVVLVPRVGDHLILFGPPERVEEKLRNLKALYKQGLSPREWNNYQVINLKFKGQVLCSKNRNI